LEKESSQIKTATPLASFSSKSFINGGVLSNIAVVTVLSLAIMTTLISLAINFWVVLVVFMLSIYLMVVFRSGNVTYNLYSWGFAQHITPSFKKRRLVKRSFKWEDLVSYRVGIDMDRQMKEYNYLKLQLHKQPFQIQMNDAKSSMAPFLDFRNAFVEQLESYNRKATHVDSGTEKKATVRKKPGFYKTWFAKVLTILFIIITALAIVYVLFQGGSVRPTNLFRIFVILLPGTAYMVYRVFWLKGD